MSPTTRSRLARVHRWLALALSPVIAVILLSGIVLAFRPILGRGGLPNGALSARVDPARVVALLDSLDPHGQARAAFLDPTRRTLGVVAGAGAPSFHDVATGRVVPPPPQLQREPDVFDIAERVHRNLWFGAEALVTLATLAMIVLVIVGPILSRPRAGGSALAWHIRLGWLVWPLVALAPLSLVMTKLHAPLITPGSHPYVAPARAVEQAARSMDLSRLLGVQALPGAALLVTTTPSGLERYLVRDGQVRPFDGRLAKLGRELHEGTWAGPWSGAISALGAMVTLVMLATGLRSWWRRRAAGVGAASRRAEPRAA